MEVFWTNFFNTIIAANAGVIAIFLNILIYLTKLPLTLIPSTGLDIFQFDAILLSVRELPTLFPNASLLQ
jgi:hypothetical protein